MCHLCLKQQTQTNPSEAIKHKSANPYQPIVRLFRKASIVDVVSGVSSGGPPLPLPPPPPPPPSTATTRQGRETTSCWLVLSQACATVSIRSATFSREHCIYLPTTPLPSCRRPLFSQGFGQLFLCFSLTLSLLQVVRMPNQAQSGSHFLTTPRQTQTQGWLIPPKGTPLGLSRTLCPSSLSRPGLAVCMLQSR